MLNFGNYSRMAPSRVWSSGLFTCDALNILAIYVLVPSLCAPETKEHQYSITFCIISCPETAADSACVCR